MKPFKITLVGALGLLVSSQAFANGFTWQANLGVAFPHFSGNPQNVVITPGLVNQYSVSAPDQADPLLGLGLAYHWDFKVSSVSLGASVYNLQTTVSGVNNPFINAGSFDTLNYSASGSSTALMLEPKFIFTRYSWQPYLLAGVGVAFNYFNDYTETPTDPAGTASPTRTPFIAQTKSNFAYEVGVGIQHPLSQNAHAPILSLDYRYMNWGYAGLGDAQAADSNLNLGQLTTGVVVLGIAWPF